MRMARIGLSIDDAVQHITGVGQMMRMLVRGLVEVAPQHQYVLTYIDHGVQPDFVRADNIELCPIKLPRLLLHRGLWPLLNWPPIETFTGTLDLFHVLTTDHAIPSRCPTIVTIHDLFPELFPQHYKATGRFFRRSLTRQMREAAGLLSISQTVGREAAAYLGISADRIVTSPLALPPEYEAIEPSDAALARFGLEYQRYFVFVGRAHYRKNTDTLLSAFALYHHHYDDSHKLVLVGSQGAQAERIFQLLEAHNITNAVVRTGYLPDEEVKGLIGGALAFVYPSRHEGFGLPVLEAQHCAVPLIASTGGALPEVAGDGALLVNPESADDLAEAMHQVATDVALRERLIGKGTANLARFHWQKQAEAAAAVYESILR